MLSPESAQTLHGFIHRGLQGATGHLVPGGLTALLALRKQPLGRDRDLAGVEHRSPVGGLAYLAPLPGTLELPNVLVGVVEEACQGNR